MNSCKIYVCKKLIPVTAEQHFSYFTSKEAFADPGLGWNCDGRDWLAYAARQQKRTLPYN